MQIDPAAHPPATSYKLLTHLVVPRPIAWVSTISHAGVVNLAPFSFFNAVGSDPPYAVVSIGRRDNGTAKDTAVNITSSTISSHRACTSMISLRSGAWDPRPCIAAPSIDSKFRERRSNSG